MKLQTEVQIAPLGTRISLKDSTMLLGSCFADGIGAFMGNAGFNVCVNPFGTLYNPLSILSSLKRLSGCTEFKESDIVSMGAGSPLLCSHSHHTSFARPTAGEFLRNANDSLRSASSFLKDCSCVIITLGTAWCFFKEGSAVANCLKRPAAEFERRMLSLEETVEALEQAVAMLDGKKVIFTVSPVRHLADGAHGNQLSKSILLLAEDMVQRRHPGTVSYFPAYELLLDQLRDYRFYAEDMTHPSSQAVAYICERFCECAVPAEDMPSIRESLKSARAAAHRPLH